MERIALLLENNKTTVVPINDVIYFESDGNYTLVKTQGNDKKMVTAKILKEIEDKMNPEHFFRISKQYLIGQIYGHRLKVDGEDENQGVFFVSEDGNKFRVPRLVTNTPSQLIFPIPELAPGHYTIEVSAIFRGRSNLRTGELPETLEVLR